MHRSILGTVLLLASLAAAAAGNADRGKELITTCQACHGPDGNSLAGTFPKLAGQNPKYLLKQMHDIMSGARPVPTMAGMLDNMTPQNLEDIAAYYSSQEIEGGAAKPELVELGEEIYRAGVERKQVAACAACHSPTGNGNHAAVFPALAGQWPEYTITQLEAFRSGARQNDGEGGMMRVTAMDLSDDEIEAVASYIYGLRD